MMNFQQMAKETPTLTICQCLVTEQIQIVISYGGTSNVYHIQKTSSTQKLQCDFRQVFLAQKDNKQNSATSISACEHMLISGALTSQYIENP